MVKVMDTGHPALTEGDAVFASPRRAALRGSQAQAALKQWRKAK